MSLFFILSKILNTILNPVIWILILLAIGLFLKNKTKAKKFLFASFFAFIFFSNNFIVDALIRWWEIPPVCTESLKPKYDVALVLGGGMVTIDRDMDRITFRHNTDRIMQAIDLYHAGKVKSILISGGAGHLVYRDIIESELLKDFFIRNGVPDSVMIVENKSDNTYQNAVCSKEILKKMDNPSVLLITSSMHMRRSMAIFKKQGIIFDIYPTNPLVGKWRFDILYIMIPSTDAFKRWDMLIHEVWGYVVYKIMGYL